MNNNALQIVEAQIREQVAAYCSANRVPGFVAGVYQAGEQVVVAHGTANVATGAPMLADTGFLFGSVAKVLTTTLVLQQVERGQLELDAPVVRYLPEFALSTPGAADKILVRHLLSHTNGIDADLYFPDAEGPDALRKYVAGLADNGTLFEAGEQLSYSNGGMIVAGRLLEVVTGLSYHALLERDIYGPVGMRNSSTSAEQAILRSTAVGHFLNPETMTAEPTRMFTLPDTWGPAGGTPIGTVADLLSFGRTHLADGVSPTTGARVLTTDSTVLMQQVSHDMATPNVPPMGLGWVRYPFGDTTVLAMSGASPGGVSLLCVLPEQDLVFTAFGNSSDALMLQDQLLQWLLRAHLGVEIPPLVTEFERDIDLTPYVGTYRSDQLRIDVGIVDGHLEERMTYEPADESQNRIFTEFAGGTTAAPPQRYVPIRPGLFAPADYPMETFDGYLRLLLVSYHDIRDGKAQFHNAGGRLTRRV
ncbi:serine hydrolase domain-containing protein [Nocardia sp. NPDC052316]|uniref:serine hydrolase domain-containing protein n=1 Tax=Nocardia sp. NPDC052316 TaxID=3364329 RepID=UPI0037C79A9E